MFETVENMVELIHPAVLAMAKERRGEDDEPQLASRDRPGPPWRTFGILALGTGGPHADATILGPAEQRRTAASA